MIPTPDLTRRACYPDQVDHAIRYGDTDRQGHVNNAVYATYFEIGRTQMLVNGLGRIIGAGRELVLVRLVIDYRQEMLWPGDISVGTGVLRVGNSSASLAQGVFQGETCTASGESVIVQLDSATRKPVPWDAQAREWLQEYQLKL